MRTGNFNHTAGCRRTLCVRRAPIVAICLLFVLFAGFLSSCGGKGGGGGGAGNYGTTVAKVRAFGIEISPDGSTIYLANNVRGEIVVMNTSTMKAAATLEVSLNDGLQYLEYDAANDWLLASHRYISDVQKFFVYDISSSKTIVDLEWTDNFGTKTKTFAYAGNKVYLANELGNIGLIDLSNVQTAAVANTSYLSGAFGIEITANANTLYASKYTCTDLCTGSDIYNCDKEKECKKMCDITHQTNLYDCYSDCQTEFGCRSSCMNEKEGYCIKSKNELYIYNTLTETEFASSPVSITGCIGVGHIILDESRDQAYASCNRSSNVAVVDVAGYQTLKTISVGVGTANLAMTPDNKYLFVSNQSDDTVSMIDLDSDTVAKTFKTDDFPAGIAVHSPYIYVTNVLGGSVSKIDYTGPSTYVAPRAVAVPAPAAGDPVTNSLHSALGH